MLILFAAYFPDFSSQWTMLGLAGGILAVDLVAMRFAQTILDLIGLPTLQVLGARFGVLQLSLAMQMMFWSIWSFTP